MVSNSGSNWEAEPLAVDNSPPVPRHGDQGSRARPTLAALPAAVTIALSREAGSRGASIAQRVGRKIG